MNGDMTFEPRLDSTGQVIRAERERVGLSLEALAKRVSWAKGTLSRYENNRIALSATAIAEIAKALGVEPEYLLLQCVKARFPKLANTRSRVGALVAEALECLQKVRTKRGKHTK